MTEYERLKLQNDDILRRRSTIGRLEAKIADELSQHELRDPDYTPSEQEQCITNDFMQGLICDDEFLRLVWQLYNEKITYRIQSGECVDCGCPGGKHWGGCGTTDEDIQND